MSTTAVVMEQDVPALPDFDPADLAAMMKKPEVQVVAETRTAIKWPDFLSKANQEYTAGNAHVFVLYGNVNDYQNSQGQLTSLRRLMMATYDENYSAELTKKDGLVVDAGSTSARGLHKAGVSEAPKRICAIFVVNEGLKFDSEESGKIFTDILMKDYEADIKAGKFPPDFLAPATFNGTLMTLGKWFEATKKRREYNRTAKITGVTRKPEAKLTMMFLDCDIFLPAGNIATMNSDRQPIGYMRNWALDKEIGNLNQIFLVTRHLTQLHESLRGGFSGISTISIPKPTLEERQEFSENFSANLENRIARLRKAGEKLKSNGRDITGLKFAEGFDHRGVAIQSAGMARNQIEKAFNEAMNLGVPVDDRQIRIVKQRCTEEEYDGVIEFTHPTHSFAQVGGHEEVKAYMRDEIIGPLREGNARTCSPGMLMTGPAGTGKTFLAMACAAEAGVNFVELKLSKLMNRYVGGTEEQTQKMIEAILAAAPCVAFLDEIEAALGGGRITTGDSNTGGRLHQTIMTFLSDQSRLGKVVIIAATNRPEFLDPALIRQGRFGAVIPVLPPPATGEESFTGRSNILKALALKHKIKFAPELQKTMVDPQVGLGRLLRDEGQIWTGAEIEAVLKDSIGLTLRAKRDKEVITLEDWTSSMDSILPSTGDVSYMTDMALLYANHVRYCPPVWQSRMRDRAALEQVKAQRLATGR